MLAKESPVLTDTKVERPVHSAVDKNYAKDVAVMGARAASGKKATDPKILDIGEMIGLTDYFLVCSAPNDRLIRTIVEEIEKAIKDKFGVTPRAIEGLQDATWVLMDYGDIVVHVMSEDARAFYALERLWSDALIVDWDEVA